MRILGGKSADESQKDRPAIQGPRTRMRAAFVLLARGFGLAGNQRFGLAQKNVGD